MGVFWIGNFSFSFVILNNNFSIRFVFVFFLKKMIQNFCLVLFCFVLICCLYYHIEIFFITFIWKIFRFNYTAVTGLYTITRTAKKCTFSFYFVIIQFRNIYRNTIFVRVKKKKETNSCGFVLFRFFCFVFRFWLN